MLFDIPEEAVWGTGGGSSLLEGVGAAFMLVAGTVVLALFLFGNFEK